MKRAVAILAVLLVLVAGLAACAVAWLGFTEPGLRYAVAQARAYLPAGMEVGPVRGRLLGTLRVDGFAYRDAAGLRVDIAQLDLRWAPSALLRGIVRIRELRAQGVRIAIPVSEVQGPPSAGFRFPVRIVLGNGQVRDIEIRRGAQDAAWRINSLSLSASARNDLVRIKRLAVEADNLAITATGDAGTMRPFPLALDVAVHWTGLANPLDVSASLAGDLDRLRVGATTPAPYAARLEARLRDLLTTPGWDGTLTLDRVTPATFVAATRMRDLTGALRIVGDANASTFDASLRATTETRPPLPVLLDTRFRADTGGFDIEAFDLRSGVNGLHARGAVRDRIDLRFQVAAEDMGALLPGFAGKLSGQGALRGTREHPRATARLKGADLGFGDLRAGALDLDLSVTDWKRYAGKLDVTARDAGTETFLLDTLSLRASENDSGHTIRLTAQRDRDALDATVNARLRADVIDGQLRSAALRVAGMDWSLERPARFRYAGGAFSIAETCLAHGGAAVCANFDRARDGAMIANAKTRNATLAIVKQWLPGDIAITGKFAAALDTRIAPDGALTGSLDATLGRGEIRFGDRDDADRVAHDGGMLHARADAGMLTAKLLLQPAPASRVEGDWQLPFDPLRKTTGDARLSGRLRAELTDLSLLTSFVPDIASPKGNITAELEFGGTVAAPRVAGNARLDNGVVGLPRLGIRLDPVRAQLTGTDDGTLRVNMEAHSGGKLELVGDIRFLGKQGLNARLDATGTNFDAARLPNVELTLSPKLRFEISPKLVRINGEIHVPRGRITARKLEDTRTPSKDVVIVGRTEGSERASRIAVDADVRVRLGDDVRIDVVGVTGRIEGALAILQKPGSDATGAGELEIRNGRYEGFGQRLEIERGRLLFAGGVVTDPRLNVRALRKIQEIEAGIDLTGTVSNPHAVLFSDPAMSETDVLSYMMFGRPASTASQSEGSALAGAATSIGLSGGELLAKTIGARFGIEDVRVENTGSSETTSLVLGTYLTPRMYVQYGVGLFDPINTLTIRYDLSKRWRVEAESGESQGGDLLFSIER